MTRLTTIMLIVFTTLILALAACGKHNNPANPGLGRLGSATAAGQRASPEAAYTDEDWKLIRMPYEERLEFIEKRFKDLVYKFHGIVIEETLTRDKATMAASTAKGHAVCVADDVRDLEEGNADWFNEQLAVTEVVDGETWSLSFLERVQGDYDFNGAVLISDITPLAQHFGDEWQYDSYWQRWQWPDDADPHLCRVSNGDGKINIADITPIAVNFGMQTRGYAV